MAMNCFEQENWDCLVNQIWADCKRLQIPESFSDLIAVILSPNSYVYEAGFIENEGFYIYCLGDRGHKELCLSGAGEEDARLFLLKGILQFVGLRIELENRDALAKKWYCYDKPVGQEMRNGQTFGIDEIVYHKDYEYSVKYDHRKFWFEYIINGILTVFGTEKAMDLIKKYTELMNCWFQEAHWKYDLAKKCFVETV